MSELNQELGYQTEEIIEQETVETPELDSTPEVVETVTDQPQSIKVKYNKEEREISLDEAPDYIQKGLNYDKVQSKAQEYQEYLERVARVTGYSSHQEMLDQLAEVERQQEAEKYESLGIDKDTFMKLASELPEFQFAKEMQERQQTESKLQQEAAELFEAFPDLKVDQIPPEVWQLREQKGVSLFDGYLRHNYKNLAQQKEQEVIQKLQKNQLTSPGALGREGAEHQTSYGKMSAADKAALRERVLRGERVDF